MKRRRIKKEEPEEEQEEEQEEQEEERDASAPTRGRKAKEMPIKSEDNTSKRSGRKRKQSSETLGTQSITVDDEEEQRAVQNQKTSDRYLNGISKGVHFEIPLIELKQQAELKWNRTPRDTTKGLAKSAARVLLMKGGKGDKLTLEHVRSSMPDYKPLARPAVREGQKLLQNIF